jgi:hypothetical protein
VSDSTPDLKAARRAIDMHIFEVMFQGYVPDYGTCETYLGFDAFVAPGLTRDIVRGVLHDLTNQGLCRFRRGQTDEDGSLVPPGYGLTQAGISAYLEMSGRTRPQGIADWWRAQQSLSH